MTPASSPHVSVAARVVAAALPLLSAEASAAIQHGHYGARAVTTAFLQLEASQPTAVHLSRRERSAALAELARIGGVL